MVTKEDHDFYNTHRLVGGKHSRFGEIFENYSSQEIREMKKCYRENEKELKIAHKAWWKKWKWEKITDVSGCCGS